MKKNVNLQMSLKQIKFPKFSTLVPFSTLNQCPHFFSTSSSPASFPLRSPEFLRRGFSDCPDISAVNILHSLYTTAVGSHRSIFTSNTLISAYCRFRHLRRARMVFDRMRRRNAATWNAMISGYVSGDLVYAAADLLRLMITLALPPGGAALCSLISGGLGFVLHPFVLKIGILSDVFVSTSLLHCYGSNGFITHACNVFDEMPTRNLITWTAMIVSFSDNHNPEMALRVFYKLRLHGVRFNQNTLTAAISSCSTVGHEPLGLQILAVAVRSGFESNLSLANSVISMLGGFGRLSAARRIFSLLPDPDTVSWNSIISAAAHKGRREEAFRLYADMIRIRTVDANATTLSSLLAAPDGSVEEVGITALVVHCIAVRLGFYGDLCLSNSLLSVYSEAGMSSSAARVFSEMPERDTISWNSMVSGLARDGSLREAFELFFRARSEANHVTFSSLFAALADDSGCVSGPARVLHGMAAVVGLDRHPAVANSLVSMYGKLGMNTEAVSVSETIPARDVVTWNALIGIHTDDLAAAVGAFREMRASPEGIIVNHISAVNLLATFLSPTDCRMLGRPVHGFVLRSGFDSDGYIKNSLITMYAECGDIGSSQAVYSEGPGQPNVVTVNAMVAACAHNGFGEKAVRLFIDVRRTPEIRLDHFTISAALAAASGLAAAEEGRQIHCVGMKLGFGSNIHVVNAAMDMYGKSGEIGELLRLLPEPPERTRVTWNVILSAFSRHGMTEVTEVFREMVELGRRPDRVTFVALLTGCSHGGMVEEGLAYFGRMEEGFGILPDVEHYGCVADMLGRAGRIEEAERFVSAADNGYGWRSVLAMCRVHRGLETGRRAAERLVEMNPGDHSAYVLYSNVCGEEGRWEEREEVMRFMAEGGVRKRRGSSWVKWRGPEEIRVHMGQM